ncbi:MAG: alkaline phosphatase [Polaromonas sp. 39-63-203]|jgi:alkaline phosphatase|uniref:alkaline phosphatase n=1 Tax=Polaromonas sp. TaxID=1869339 RepID=UPI000BDB3198|nr:alkaline phosphatase [Polaromonas sp.]OYY53472.1 MAG: alkaline phosphatase [Polaromonas sp. 35-63-240]OYZ01853.1 MAG: alkaline phosphatase [Polaromonas sp. 28-63-22]OYZ84672.1 MAG: alkaline phosphatase [Polaromonas sp. 24-62-144]OZB01130.1 MAG: alkaline phosphatase [Polaromonas sp. 39-63-203]HQS31753.1 alkaline phosphatase [Polaromonas sp.]
MKSFSHNTGRLIRPLLAIGTLALAASQAFAAGEAKNVILFIGDGMGPVTVTASRIFKYGEAGSLAMDTMPRAARIRTFSLDAQTTDSAPSMAAYTTGVKTRNDVIAMDGNTKTFTPSTDPVTGVSSAINNCPTTGNGAPSPIILEQAIAKGKATGVVTTARLTHATPAATYAHVCNRDAEYEIARQAVPGGPGSNTALGKGVDVLLGGISYYWRPYNATTNPRGRPDGRDLVAELQAKGYNAASDLTTFNAAGTDKPLIGLFDQALKEGQMSYELDRDPALEPSIAQMTTKAIDILSKNPNGYFLMVEGGRIDHALHGNNAKRALADTIAFDDAIKAALGKVDLANTLIVVTADHDHTMAFNGYSPLGNDILGKSVNIKTKKPQMAADGKPYTTLVFGNGTTPRNDPATGARADLTNVDTSGDKNYKQQVAVPLGGSETHGGGDVMLLATGAGSKVFKGSLDNTKVFGLMRQAFGF